MTEISASSIDFRIHTLCLPGDDGNNNIVEARSVALLNALFVSSYFGRPDSLLPIIIAYSIELDIHQNDTQTVLLTDIAFAALCVTAARAAHRAVPGPKRHPDRRVF